MIITSTLRDRILHVSQESGLSWEEISHKTGISIETIDALIANEIVEISESNLVIFSVKLKVEYLWLSKGEGPKEELPLVEKISRMEKETSLLRRVLRTPGVESHLELYFSLSDNEREEVNFLIRKLSEKNL
ncbi:hypothetical protein JWG44_05480 [Leptospira sp. 201903071]|uniref:hypothetical protein n=1 Tax=Leptospira ainazelensis TaxID=2810034 RepID=UPI00196325C5|nr:hypothetical protein [Leptospira ainazelensis]MBM9499701.1 hypothetical protein [Leptospira ainazelensis]